MESSGGNLNETLTYYLYRVRLYPPQQGMLFSGQFDRLALLRAAIVSSPTVRLRKTIEWHVGNVEEIGEHAIYFRMGKTTRRIRGVFDSNRSEFLDQEIEDAPYSHIVLDRRLQVAIISRNTKLAPDARALGKRLSRLLGEARPIQEAGAVCEVVPIRDPKSFLQALKSAYVVRRFSVEILRPNPWDVDEDFIKPAEKSVESLNGERGQVTVVSGPSQDLDRDKLEPITRSAAASGVNVKMSYKEKQRSKTKIRSLRDSVVSVDLPVDDVNKNGASVLEALQSAYGAVREGDLSGV